MKNLISSLLLLYFSVNAQYCIFFDIVDEPEMVVSAMTELMNTD